MSSRASSQQPGTMRAELLARLRASGPAAPVWLQGNAGAWVDVHLSRTLGEALHTDAGVDAWLDGRLRHRGMETALVSLHGMDGWEVEEPGGNIRHRTGRFFSITGVTVRHRSLCGEILWDQPVIDQPEVGILGILAASIGGVLHFCLQAKEEPGNLGSLQLSPTVQATYSNYTLVHGGSPVPGLGYFLDPPRETILFAKQQTEDGGRFLYKSNRNMIILLSEAPADLPGNCIWLTLRQVRRLLARDNLVHACTRSVLSAVALRPDIGLAAEEAPLAAGGAQLSQPSLHDALQWLDDQRTANHIYVKRIPMRELDEWRMDGDGVIRHRDKRFFSISGISVRSTGREVASWQQPILANAETGIIGLLVQRRDGRRRFLMQAKADVGNAPTVQVGPTVQFSPLNYLANEKLPKPFLFDEFSQGGSFGVVWENRQSEEGARFYREQHLHRILELPEGERIDIPPGFRWFSDDELAFFLELGNTVNSCARSILACLL